MKEENWKWLQRLWLFLVEFQRWMAPPPKLSCVLCNRTNTTSTFVEVFSLLMCLDFLVMTLGVMWWRCLGLFWSGFWFSFLSQGRMCRHLLGYSELFSFSKDSTFDFFFLSYFIYLLIEGPISSASLIPSFIMKY